MFQSYVDNLLQPCCPSCGPWALSALSQTGKPSACTERTASEPLTARQAEEPAAADTPAAVQFARIPSDLEMAGRAMSIASARSVASFNSEEGFGSPSTRRKARQRTVPRIAEQFPVCPGNGPCVHGWCWVCVVHGPPQQRGGLLLAPHKASTVRRAQDLRVVPAGLM